MIGQTISHYRIVERLGEGGMGEVYLAEDTSLGRRVALKFLPEELYADPVAHKRFLREARSAAALDHPYICNVFEVASTDGGTNFIVMEYVEGETLQARLERGPLSLKETLKLGTELAEALESAHTKGIIHRDLKPANIMLTPAGHAKVMDFGLAKRVIPEGADTQDLSSVLTGTGAVLGTLPYMSPEHIRGQAVDHRSDIFSLGIVLYETLAGVHPLRKAQPGETAGAILKEDPPPLSRYVAEVPELLRHTIDKMLAKDPTERFQSVHEVLTNLNRLKEDSGKLALVGGEVAARSRHSLLPWAFLGVLATTVAVLTFLWLRTPAPERVSARFEIHPPGDTQFTYQFGATAISPDGRYIVFGAGGKGTPSRLWLRPLNSLTARPLEGTENANLPFWSPDSQSVAFYQGGKLKRSDIAGGVPLVLCDMTETPGTGGTWNRKGTILFASAGGLFRVASSGGVPRPVTELDPTRREVGHGPPQFLPDGNHFLYFIQSSDPNVRGIYAASLDNPKERVRVVATERKAYYVSPRDRHPGYLLWMRERTLLAQPFDSSKMSVSGDPAPVAEDVALGGARGSFWTSDAGLLAYHSGDTTRRLVWMSGDGQALGEARKEDRYNAFRLSPDGKRVAVSLDEGGNRDIWVLEFGREMMTRLTFDPATEDGPVWSPDGSQIAYYSDRSGIAQIYRTAAGGGGPEEQLTNGANRKFPTDWSRDGRYLSYMQRDPKTGGNLWALPLEGERKPTVVLQTPFNEYGAQSSPDGEWIVYGSDSSGMWEVYVRAFPPGPGNPWQVSTQGGSWPRWRADGRELFYVGGDGDVIMAASVRTGEAGFESEAPRELFRVAGMPVSYFPYDVTADGQRFLVLQPSAETQGPAPLTLITNWQAGLKQ